MKKSNRKAYLIGGGIASLASAVYLIKDGKLEGKNVNIFEEIDDVGGSLDGSGSPKKGYFARGGRMFSKEVYSCTFDLFSKIPINEKSSKTLLDDFVEFNRKIKTNAKARLVRNGKIIDSSAYGLNIRDDAIMVKVMSLPESSLGNSKINDYFSPDFFQTNFWFIWCTTFSFQPWHSVVEFRRYIQRFIQELPRANTMTGVRHTRYNQFDSVITPITNWLKKKGVNFLMKSQVVSLGFIELGDKEQVQKIVYKNNLKKKEIFLNKDDLVFFTNGSMTTNTSIGSMTHAPRLNQKPPSNAWKLWEEVAKNRPHFGKPSVFNSKIDKSKWESFTVTFRDKTFSNLMEKFTGNEPGTGGFTTITDSSWLLTLVTPPHPHFINQTKDINVFWGYGLFPDKKGDFVDKKMSECNGKEILTEVCAHLGFSDSLSEIIRSADCISCMMPYLTSQFMPRKKGDRPSVIPEGTINLAFIGQYCEIPDEVVFTVEQSVRSAMIAVYGLLEINKEIPAIYQGKYESAVMKEWSKWVLT